MSKVFAAHDVLLNLTAWRNETTNPNAGAGTAGAIGSFWQRNGTYAATPATPVETYLKTGLDNFGWCKQNTVNLDVYNVKTYGALGNGMANDRDAIQAAITAANAAGGGTIYFPPGNYLIHRVTAALGSFELGNMSNLTFLGDGYASTLQMAGDAAGATWYLFHIYDRSQRIVFNNLRFLGDNFDDPNPVGQHFFIHIWSDPPDIGPPHNIDIVGVWFDTILRGAPIRIAGFPVDGGPDLEPHDVRIYKNAFNVGDGGLSTARSALEGQRCSRKVQNHYNWMTGAKNSLIDCEPSDEGAPSEWSHIGNHLLYNGNSDSEAVNIRGRNAAIPSQRTIFSFNTITNGGNVAGGFGSNIEMRGNIVVMAVASAFAEAVLYMLNNGGNLNISGNIFVSTSTTGNRLVIKIIGEATGEGASNVISNNICTGLSTTSDGSGMEITGNTELVVNGNVICFDCTVADQTGGIKLRATSRVGDHWVAAGNLVIGTNARLLTGIRASTTAHPLDLDIRNVAFCYNYTRNTSTGMTFDAAGSKVFLDGRECNNNNCVAASTKTVALPPTNVGVTFEGNAGKGSQISSQAFAAGAEGLIVAAPGSLNANQSGLPGAVIQYKESGAAAAGWFGLGSSEITFGALILSTATAARFLAPGADLAVEGTAEIKLVMVRPGNIRNWRVVCTAGVGVLTITYTMRKNGVSQDLPIAIGNTATSGSSIGSFAVVAGDLISVQVTKSAAPGTPQANVVVTLELTG